jgi:ferredoxin
MTADSAAPLQVGVDLNRCQGYAQCCFLAPEVFELHGQEALWYDPAPDPAQCERVRAAAAACPVQAIRVAWPHETTTRRNGAAPHA